MKSKKNLKRLNYNDIINNSNKLEDDKSKADSNEFLKERSLFSPGKKKTTYLMILTKISRKYFYLH